MEQIQADDLKLDPSLDRDIKGAKGSPDIAATLFSKIRAADLFIADVSIINPARSEQCRPTPNPNVLAELGYAAGFHGWERIVCILNTAFGGISELPFDIRHRRIVDYELSPEEDKKGARKELTTLLRNTIRSALADPHSDTEAHSVILLDCPLTEDEYDMPAVRLRADHYQRLGIELHNPLEKVLDSVHICYKEFDLFYMPWRHRAWPKNDPIVGGYSYYWLTDYQLEELKKRPQTVRFILNGRRCGEHELVLLWKMEGKSHQRTIKVVVEPDAG
jgi:hypothetical protein